MTTNPGTVALPFAVAAFALELAVKFDPSIVAVNVPLPSDGPVGEDEHDATSARSVNGIAKRPINRSAIVTAPKSIEDDDRATVFIVGATARLNFRARRARAR